MMKNKIYFSTGAFVGRWNGNNHKLIIAHDDQFNCNGYEFMMSGNWYDNIDEITAELSESGISFPTCHSDKRIGILLSEGSKDDIDDALRKFDINCRAAKVLGCEIIVIHLWGYPGSDNNIDVNINALEQLLDIAKQYDITASVENVPCTHGSPKDYLNRILDRYPTCKFTMDMRLALFHDEIDDILGDAELWNAVNHIHISDYNGGYKQWDKLRNILHPGEGAVDFRRVFNRICDNGYDGGMTLESHGFRRDGSIDFDRMNKSFDFLQDLL